jgi:hypothetical protein
MARQRVAVDCSLISAEKLNINEEVTAFAKRMDPTSPEKSRGRVPFGGPTRAVREDPDPCQYRSLSIATVCDTRRYRLPGFRSKNVVCNSQRPLGAGRSARATRNGNDASPVYCYALRLLLHYKAIKKN